MEVLVDRQGAKPKWSIAEVVEITPSADLDRLEDGKILRLVIHFLNVEKLGDEGIAGVLTSLEYRLMGDYVEIQCGSGQTDYRSLTLHTEWPMAEDEAEFRISRATEIVAELILEEQVQEVQRQNPDISPLLDGDPILGPIEDEDEFSYEEEEEHEDWVDDIDEDEAELDGLI